MSRRRRISRVASSESVFDETPHAGRTLCGGGARPPGCREPALERLVYRELDLLWLGSCLQRIHDCALWGRDRHAVEQPDLRKGGWVLERVEADSRTRSLAALGARQRDVHCAWDHVGEVVQLERALVRDDRRGLAQRQPGGDDMLVWLEGKCRSR